MMYEVTVQAISQGHVTVEADSPEKAEAAAQKQAVHRRDSLGIHKNGVFQCCQTESIR